jgi:tetratricopeptide (TPR) repeat protein
MIGFRRTVVLLLCALIAGAACTGDPAVRKKRVFDQGVHDFQNGKYNEAVIAFRNSLQIDPDYTAALFQLGGTYRRKGWLIDARVGSEKAVRTRPDFAEARYELGEVLLEMGLVAEAGKEANALLSHETRSACAQTLLGNVLLREPKYPGATQAFDAALAGDPTLADALAGKGSVSLAQGNIAQARTEFQRGLALDSASIEAHLGLARSDVLARRLADARKALEAVLQKDPDHRSGRLELAMVLSEQGQRDEAISVLEVVADKVQDLRLELLRGEFCLRKGDFAKTESIMASLVHRMPQLPAPRFVLGNAYLGQRKGRQAVQELELATRAVPRSALAQMRLGVAYVFDGRPMAALVAFEAAQKLDPKLSGLDLHLAGVSMQLGRFSEAARQAEAMCGTSAGDPSGYEVLGMAYTGLKDYQKALDVNPRRTSQPRFVSARRTGRRAMPRPPSASSRRYFVPIPAASKPRPASSPPCSRRKSMTRSSAAPVKYPRRTRRTRKPGCSSGPPTSPRVASPRPRTSSTRSSRRIRIRSRRA